MPSVVVTGVSSGIGWGTAKVLLQHGFQVFGSVRKQEDANRLSAEWGKAFTPLLFDITDEQAVRQAAAVVADHLQGQTLAGLVNNAGIAVPAPLIYEPIREYRQQLEVNLVGPLIVTQAFADLLGAEVILVELLTSVPLVEKLPVPFLERIMPPSSGWRVSQIAYVSN